MKKKFASIFLILFSLSHLIWAQRDDSSLEHYISEIPKKAWAFSKEQILEKAKKDYLKIHAQQIQTVEKIAEESKGLEELEKRYEENNHLVSKLQIQSKQLKIKTLESLLKIIQMRFRWTKNKIFLLEKDPQNFVMQDDSENPLYVTHEKLFEIFLPSSLPLTDKEKEFAVQAKNRIWNFIMSNEKARLGLMAFLLIPGLSEEDTFESAENYYRLLRSNVPFIRKLAKEFRFLYLLLIYESELGKSISSYNEQARPTEYPDLEEYVKNFKSNVATHFAQDLIYYNQSTKEVSLKEDIFDYIIVGSGPAGAVLAHELRKNGKKVILIERGSFVVPGAIDPVRISSFKEKSNMRTSEDGAIIIRNGNAVGGGSTVNIDLAFSPNLDTIQRRIENWRQKGYIGENQFSKDEITNAYSWVVDKLSTRKLRENEINENNKILWTGSKKLQWEPSLYDLNRFVYGKSPYVVTDKISAVDAFILQALLDENNPLHLLENAEVTKVLYEQIADGTHHAYAVEVTKLPSWYGKGTITDLHSLCIPEQETFIVKAKQIVLTAGSFGTATILLKSGIDKLNSNVGKGIVIHPSIPIIGVFRQQINIMSGLTASVYNDHFALKPGHGFILESMSAGPEYAALMLQGNGQEIYDFVCQYRHLGGFGVMLVDDPSPDNKIILNDKGIPEIVYTVTENDKVRFRKGVQKAMEIIFAADAQKVTLPTTENLFAPKSAQLYFHNVEEALNAIDKLQFVPNQTVLTSAHMQGSNKMGLDPKNSVVDTNGKVWGFDNLYIGDSSIFPTSVGANPMQSIYTFAKILADHWNIQNHKEK